MKETKQLRQCLQRKGLGKYVTESRNVRLKDSSKTRCRSSPGSSMHATGRINSPTSPLTSTEQRHTKTQRVLDQMRSMTTLEIDESAKPGMGNLEMAASQLIL